LFSILVLLNFSFYYYYYQYYYQVCGIPIKTVGMIMRGEWRSLVATQTFDQQQYQYNIYQILFMRPFDGAHKQKRA